MTVVDLSCTYKDSEESHQLFDSVSAAAVWFAHEVRRNLPANMDPEEVFDAVAVQVALLFSDYDSTTPADPEEVHGGDDHCRYGIELKSVSDLELARSDARDEDESAGLVKKPKPKKEKKDGNE